MKYSENSYTYMRLHREAKGRPSELVTVRYQRGHFLFTPVYRNVVMASVNHDSGTHPGRNGLYYSKTEKRRTDYTMTIFRDGVWYYQNGFRCPNQSRIWFGLQKRKDEF